MNIDVRISFFLCVTIAMAGNPVSLTWENLLASASVAPKYQASTQRVDLLHNPVGLGIWKEAQLRYEADGMDLRDHKFEVRVSPIHWGVREASIAEWDTRRKINTILKEETLADALQERYKLGIEYLYRNREYQYHNALQKVYQDRVQVHLQLVNSDRFDPEDLVITEQMVASINGEILADQNALAQLTMSLQTFVTNTATVELDTMELVSIHDIQIQMDTLLNRPEYEILPIKEAQLRLDLVDRQSQLEKRTNNALLSYVQTGYALQIPPPGKKDKTSLIQDISVGLGITIPFGDSREQDELRRQMDQINGKTEYIQVTRDIATKLGSLRLEISSLLRQKAVLDSFVARVDAGTLFSDYLRRAGSDPLLLLKVQASSLEVSWRSEKLRYEIYLRYVRLLELTGVLSQEPTRNHLRKRTHG